VDFCGCPRRDISSRIAVVMHSAWAMGHLHWLGLGPMASSLLAIGLHRAYTFDVFMSIQKS
jgi:hypothetical protein